MVSTTIDDFVQFHKGEGFLPCSTTIAPGFEIALNEIKKGKKTTHWAWYIIPINKSSRTFRNRFVLHNEDEIKAFIETPLLYNNYITFLTAIIEQLHNGIEPIDLLNSQVDVNKLNESVTLFNKQSLNHTILYELTTKIMKLLSDKIYYKQNHPLCGLF
jgi:uncharacterized protein (DUF1810 family)